MKKLFLIQTGFLLAILAVIAISAEETVKDPKRIEFSKQQIEGKIRRPQMVLIKAEQRPTFTPMVMQSLAGNTSVVEFVSPASIEKSPYDNAFLFIGQKISNYVP